MEKRGGGEEKGGGGEKRNSERSREESSIKDGKCSWYMVQCTTVEQKEVGS